MIFERTSTNDDIFFWATINKLRKEVGSYVTVGFWEKWSSSF